MIPAINLPFKIVRLFTSNVSPGEVAAGVCLGMFMGFVPLNGPITVVLIICFFMFKINRLAAMLVFPVFKLLYIIGIHHLTDLIGSFLLIDAGFLAAAWSVITHFPVLALLELNNTLIAGGLGLSLILCFPVFMISKKGIVILRKKYFEKLKNSRIVKWFLKIPFAVKIMAISSRVKGEA